MFCTACGVKNADQSNYCRQCGHKLDRAPGTKPTEAEFERALPEEEQLDSLLARAYDKRKLGDAGAAITLCEEALRLRPDSTSAHSLLGQCYEQTGDVERAIVEYERVLQLNPGSIADRVKLDELRAREETGGRRGDAARILVVDRAGRSGVLGIGGVQLAALAAGAVIIFICGGLAQRTFLARTAPGKQHAVDAQARPVADNTPVNSSHKVETSSHAEGEADASHGAAANSAVVAPQGPAAATGTQVAPGNYAPIYLYPAPPTQRPVYTVQQPGPVAADATLPVITPRNGQHGKALRSGANALALAGQTARGNTAGASERVRLPDEIDGVTQQGTNYVIRVSPNGAGKTDDTAQSGSAPPVKATIIVRSSSAQADSDTDASSDSQSLIAMAEDLNRRGNTERALVAYRKALPNAGERTGFIYQKIGQCYQSKGDKGNAVASYQHAISELQKLIAAGRQVDMARSGIRVCESGIKICSNE